MFVAELWKTPEYGRLLQLVADAGLVKCAKMRPPATNRTRNES